MTVYTLNGILSSIAVLALGFAIGADWRNIRPPWRAVLIAGVAEQAVLAYGSWEAADSHVPVEARQVLFLLSIAALTIATLIALVRSWRSGELTSPNPRTTQPPQENPR